MNPGPHKYPCTNCKEGVRSNQRAIQCDLCDEWTHMKYTTISLSQFNKLSTSDETFYCTKCIDRLPCFTDSFFHNISIRSSDTEFSNTGSSECGTYMYQQNVNTVDEIESECDNDIFDELKNLRRKNPNKFLIAYLNINCLRYKL